MHISYMIVCYNQMFNNWIARIFSASQALDLIFIKNMLCHSNYKLLIFKGKEGYIEKLNHSNKIRLQIKRLSDY